jgi:hypothetical protein
MQTGYPVMVVVVVVVVIIADVTVPAATNPARLRRIVLKVILKSDLILIGLLEFLDLYLLGILLMSFIQLLVSLIVGDLLLKLMKSMKKLRQ